MQPNFSMCYTLSPPPPSNVFKAHSGHQNLATVRIEIDGPCAGNSSTDLSYAYSDHCNIFFLSWSDQMLIVITAICPMCDPGQSQ